MPLLYLLEFLSGVFLVIIVVNQIIVPIKKGLPIFPFFRKTRRLSEELTKVNEDIENLKLEQEIERGKRLIAKKKS